jgi:hypothetical protein
MPRKFTLPFLFLPLTISVLSAQSAKDATVPLTATVSTNPASVTLNWSNPSPATLLIQRRVKGQSGFLWTTLLNAPGSTLTSYTDNNVTAGQTYEYYLRRTTTISAHGYAHVALEAPVTDSRGKLILFVDADIVAPLTPELERLKNDLAGDGWQIIEHNTDASATVQTIKNQIVADYNADPANVKSVFLLGKIPVPYSGNTAWDGHSPDHTGAWPSDAYYADINGNWTDNVINNTAPDRAANDNVPGDGKFDQNTIPSPVELQVGRVDFRRLTEGTFGATTVELLKRYLDKNHNWRTGAYTVENKALVDDNFGYFNGEAFAANGFRNAYPLVGEANIVEDDFFNNTNPDSYLLGYGTGGGSYTSAGGVGNSTNFATDTVHIVFSNLFGSYHGDWDFETNPFMPSALASRGGILTCAWAGRPHHFYQALASGETIGHCIKETQNAQTNNGFFPSFGESGAHVALLGDPTLRAHIVAPPTNVTAISGCGKVDLIWTESSDTGVSGYHVYRSFEKHGAYTRLTTNAINGNSFVDNNPVQDTLYYQIRALKLQTSPGGGRYWNTSTGAMTTFVYSETNNGIPDIFAADGTLTCSNPTVQLDGGSDTPGATFFWTGPGGFTSTQEDPIVAEAGTYTLTVVAPNGCTAQATATVVQSASEILIDEAVTNESAPGANDGGIALALLGNSPFTFIWSNGATTQNLLNIPGGTYSVTITDAGGCTAVAEFVVQTTSSTDESAALQQLLLSPNPTEGLALLSIKLHKTAAVRIAVHDAAGHLILEKPEVTASELTWPLDLRDSPPGIYTVFVFVENEVFVRKMAVVR